MKNKIESKTKNEGLKIEKRTIVKLGLKESSVFLSGGVKTVSTIHGCETTSRDIDCPDLLITN